MDAAGDATANQVVGMLVLYRLVMLSFGLLGSLALLGGGIKLQGAGDAEPEATQATDTP